MKNKSICSQIGFSNTEPCLAILEIAFNSETAGQIDWLAIDKLTTYLATINAHLGVEIVGNGFKVNYSLFIREPLDDIVLYKRRKVSASKYPISFLILENGKFWKTVLIFSLIALMVRFS